MVPSMVMRKGMSFAEYNREKDTRAYMAIPIDHIYIFINVLQQVYKDLSNECLIFTTALLPKTSLTALIYIYSNPFVYIF